MSVEEQGGHRHSPQPCGGVFPRQCLLIVQQQALVAHVELGLRHHGRVILQAAGLHELDGLLYPLCQIHVRLSLVRLAHEFQVPLHDPLKTSIATCTEAALLSSTTDTLEASVLSEHHKRVQDCERLQEVPLKRCGARAKHAATTDLITCGEASQQVEGGC